MSSRLKQEGQVWIVSGPSGSGKTSLCEALLNEAAWRKRIRRSVSYTTRPQRSDEREGKDYIYVTPKQFAALKKRGAFLETEKIFSAYYGTPKKYVQKILRAGKDALLCIDVKGARFVRRAFKRQSVSVFILPPHPQALGDRLKKRSTEQKKEVEKRLRRVKIELSYIRDYDYIIINDVFQEALDKMKAIFLSQKCRRENVLRSIGKAY